MTMNTSDNQLYRLDPDLSCHVMESNIMISNGIGWSPNQRTMYLTDSPRRLIYAYNYDQATNLPFRYIGCWTAHAEDGAALTCTAAEYCTSRPGMGEVFRVSQCGPPDGWREVPCNTVPCSAMRRWGDGVEYRYARQEDTCTGPN